MFSSLFLIKNNLNSSIICCQNYIRTICSVTCERDNILEWFQHLCDQLTNIITLIGKYYKQDKEKLKDQVQNTLLLYLTQTLTSLSLLINIFVKEEEIKHVITEARNCVIKQLSCCLECLEATINSGGCLIDPSGNFVKWMDAALEKVGEINAQQEKMKTLEAFEETRTIFEEVLSHAMSIAQVSLPEDGKIIRGSCQTVLQTINSLSKEVKSTIINKAMINLFVDACSSKLCNLERKVNTAVLKMCMVTFSNFTEPLQNIHDFCFDQSNRKKIEDIDGLVVEFDLHVDRIMQIGLFAVSCSSNLARGIKIRSCLASLEALESELVPSLHAVLLDDTVHNKNCALLLMRHWLNQAFALQHFIFLIIDPGAFCQVIYEEVTEIVDNFSASVKKKIFLTQNDASKVLKVTKVLQAFLSKAQSEFSELETDRLKTKLKDLNDIVEEVESASKVLLNEEVVNLENSLRVLKRCKILLTILKRIWYCFVDDLPNKNDTLGKVSEQQVRDLSLKFENLPIETVESEFLDHIVHRGWQLLQERSILYKTPKKNKSCNIISGKKKEIPLSKLVHLRKFGFMDNTKKEASLDLQITDILNEMTNLSTTFCNK